MRVLLMEQDSSTAANTRMLLRDEGFDCDAPLQGKDGLEMGKLYDYDIILLDIVLSDINGFDVLRRLRDARVHTPIMVVSGLSETTEKVKAFELGADDYLTKPFDIRELVARIHAVVRRAEGHPGSLISTGRLSLNLDTRVVRVDGKITPMTGREYAILQLLVLRKGRVVSKEAFLDHLYGGMPEEPELPIVDQYICKLRKKIRRAGDYIDTIPGYGYRMRDIPSSDSKPNTAGTSVAPN